MQRSFTIKKSNLEVAVAFVSDNGPHKVVDFVKYEFVPRQRTPNISDVFATVTKHTYPLQFIDSTVVTDVINVVFGNEVGFNIADYVIHP